MTDRPNVINEEPADEVTATTEAAIGEGIGTLLARGASTAMAISVAAAGIVFGVQVVLTRLLGPERFGRYFYAVSWLVVLLIFGAPGLHSATLRFAATYRAQGEWPLVRGFFRRSRQFALLASVLTGAVFAAAVWTFQSHLEPQVVPLLYVVALILPLYAQLDLATSGLLALKRVAAAKIPVELLRPLLLLTMASTAMLPLNYPRSSMLLLGLHAASTAAVLVLSLTLLRAALPREARAVPARFDTRDWVEVLLPLIAMSAMMAINSRADVLMLGLLRGAKEVGLYSGAFRLSTLVLFGLLAVNAIAAPMYAELHSLGKKDQLQHLVALAARGLAAFTIPVAAALVVFGRPLLRLFGPEFDVGYPALMILTAGNLVNALSGSVGYLLTMTGRHNFALGVLSASVVINVVLNVVLIPPFGMVGAAAATTTAMMFWNLAMLVFVVKLLGVNPSVLSILRRRR